MNLGRKVGKAILRSLGRILRVPKDLKAYFDSKPTSAELDQYLTWAEDRRNVFLTIHQRPRRAQQVNVASTPTTFESTRKFAIVIQGPIARDDDFTLETCRLYRKLHPRALVVLSTWESERGPYMQKFLDEGIETIYNAAPAVSGFWNTNFQIVSTRAGIEVAQAMGGKYILKTRSDQRFYATNLFEYLEALIHAFPLVESASKHQIGRLITINLGTCKYRPYAVSDMFLFGYAEDVQKFWDQPLDSRTSAKKDFHSIREELQFRGPEIYFVENYLKTHRRTLTFTLADGWDVLAKHFCVVDSAAVDMYWRKYERHKEFRYREYGSGRTSEMLDFKDWLVLWAGNVPGRADESILDMPFGAVLQDDG